MQGKNDMDIKLLQYLYNFRLRITREEVQDESG